MSSKKWKYAVGEKGGTVTVYEREVGGLLHARAFDPSLQSGKGGYRRVSLGHRDKDRAKAASFRASKKLADFATRIFPDESETSAALKKLSHRPTILPPEREREERVLENNPVEAHETQGKGHEKEGA